MMWTAHKAALFPAPVKIGTVPLRPITVGQYMVLEHLESPYVCGGIPMEGDFLTALLVMSMRHGDAANLIRRPRWLGLRQRWLAMKIARARLSFGKESGRLYQFIRECSWVPERFSEPGEQKNKARCVPYSYSVLAALLPYYTEREILSMAINKANLIILAKRENEGDEYETRGEYEALGLPEGWAYWPEDFPEIKAAMTARIQQAEKRKATA